MPITIDELTGTVSGTEPGQSSPPPQSQAGETDKGVRIVEWVDAIPQHRRISPFDSVVEEIRRLADPTRVAKIEWEEKPISPNKVNQLRKRYPDCEFKQVTVPDGRETYVSYKG
jgi:hypothetical protein